MPNPAPHLPPSDLAQLPIGGFLETLASKTPAPGGGAVAGLAGAVAAALGSMVVAYSTGKPSLSEHQTLLDDAARRLERARTLFLTLADEDAEAYAALNAVQKLPKDDPRRRADEPAAVAAALAVPRSVLAGASDLLRLLQDLAGRTNRHLGSDLAIAAVLAEATAAAAAWNIRVNLPLLREDTERAAIGAEAASILRSCVQRRGEIEHAVASAE
jgi:formiminotetrahydrofolate cyclodeaminase